MNKQDLIAAVADSSGLTKGDASKAVEAVFDSITGALKKAAKSSRRLRHLRGQQAQGVDRPQPAHRRNDDHRGVEPAEVQGR